MVEKQKKRTHEIKTYERFFREKQLQEDFNKIYISPKKENIEHYVSSYFEYLLENNKEEDKILEYLTTLRYIKEYNNGNK